MKKYIRCIFSLLCCIALSTTILITASAHPGGTNADGGHWDYDAGEYHYHHGYPAHDHYDSNGDGIVDCPYDFDDQTGINSGSSSSGETNSRSYSSYDYDPPETITVYKDREVIKEVPVTPTWIKWVLGISVVWIFYLLMSNRAAHDWNVNLERSIEHLNQTAKEKEAFHKDELQRMYEVYKDKCFQFGKTHKEEIDKIASDKDKIISTLQCENASLRAELHSVISSIPVGEAFYPDPKRPELLMYKIEIPEDVYFNENRVPVKGIISNYAPFGEYTVFTLKNSPVYHFNKYCSNTFNTEPVHLFWILGRKRPCQRCGKNHDTMLPIWYMQLLELKSKL